MKRIYKIKIALLLILASSAMSQTSGQVYDKIQEINILFDSLKIIETDSLKLQLNQTIRTKLKQFLLQAESFSIPVDSFKKTGIIEAPDKKFRFCTWNIAMDRGKHSFSGIIQMNPEKNSSCQLYVLNDVPDQMNGRIQNISFKAPNWYGALYYDIVKVKYNKKDIYTLIGTRFNNLFTTKKVIETLQFSESTPVFGIPMMEFENKTEKRVIFEYSVNARMSIRYDKDQEMIIFDHLAPSQPIHTGNYKFYGPDFSFDAFKYEKNSWKYIPNIEVKNQKRTTPRKPIRKSDF